MPADLAVFFNLLLRKPRQIAALNPSGQRLADRMARLIDLTRPGPILELGAGTGSLTRGAIRAGCPVERLIALECEPRLVNVLRRDFPAMRIIEGDAIEIDALLGARIDRLAAVLSSLPIKWFPVEAQAKIVGACLARLGPGGEFLQLTNGFSSPLAIDRLGIRGQEIARVWLNLFPTQIWSYTQCTDSPCPQAPRR